MFTAPFRQVFVSTIYVEFDAAPISIILNSSPLVKTSYEEKVAPHSWRGKHTVCVDMNCLARIYASPS